MRQGEAIFGGPCLRLIPIEGRGVAPAGTSLMMDERRGAVGKWLTTLTASTFRVASRFKAAQKKEAPV
jgi:hypothetical protein